MVLIFTGISHSFTYENVMNNENCNFIGPPNENLTFHSKRILDNWFAIQAYVMPGPKATQNGRHVLVWDDKFSEFKSIRGSGE